MSEINNIVIDPWLKNNQHDTLPNSSMFVCAYNLHLGADSIVEALYFHRSENTDELWVVDFTDASAKEAILASETGFVSPDEEIIKTGRVVAIPIRGKELSTCTTLLDYLIRSRVGYGWPTKFIKAGLIKQYRYKKVLKQINDELEHNSEAALKNKTAIIRTAHLLGLNPQPAGTNQNNWQANCPETQHYIMITATANEFGCGYCRRKGGVNELIEFVRERKQRAEERRVNT